MERETKKINLDFCEIEVKTYLTWGEHEKIENVLFSGAKGIGLDGVKDFDATILTEEKFVLLETAIVNIKQGEKELKFDREWFKNLKKEEGDKIISEINNVVNEAKKK